MTCSIRKQMRALKNCLVGRGDDWGGVLLAICVVPADVELCYLLRDALRYRSAAGDDQPPRHQIKRSTWMKRENTKYCNKMDFLQVARL